MTTIVSPEAAGAPTRFVSGGFLLVLSGPSGAGKGTLVDHLVRLRPDCIFSISSTTRPKRDAETESMHYRFVSPEEFERLRRDNYFLEWAEVHGNLYGTPAVEVDDHVRQGRVVVLDVDVQGGESVRKARPDAVSVFVHPPSLDALRQRLARRGSDVGEVVERRIANAPGELAQWVHYDYMIVNYNLEQAAATLVAIHDAERARVGRLRPES